MGTFDAAIEAMFEPPSQFLWGYKESQDTAGKPILRIPITSVFSSSRLVSFPRTRHSTTERPTNLLDPRLNPEPHFKTKYFITMKGFLLLASLSAVLATPVQKRYDFPKLNPLPPFRPDTLCFGNPYGGTTKCNLCRCDPGWQAVNYIDAIYEHGKKGGDEYERWCEKDDENPEGIYYGPVGRLCLEPEEGYGDTLLVPSQRKNKAGSK